MLSAGNEIVVASCRSARQYRPAKASAATNLQQEGDKFSPYMDDSSEPPSARIDAFGTYTPSHSAFFSGPIEQHLQGCAWFNEGVAQAVVAGAAACPEKSCLLLSLMANVKLAINCLNIGLEMCEDRRGHRVEADQQLLREELKLLRETPAIGNGAGPSHGEKRKPTFTPGAKHKKPKVIHGKSSKHDKEGKYKELAKSYKRCLKCGMHVPNGDWKAHAADTGEHTKCKPAQFMTRMGKVASMVDAGKGNKVNDFAKK